MDDNRRTGTMPDGSSITFLECIMHKAPFLFFLLIRNCFIRSVFSEESLEWFREIKQNIGRSVALRELRPGTTNQSAI